MTFLTIRNLTFKRGEHKILDRANLDIPRGKIIGLMGPSGTGKTTLLRLIGGQLRPHAGEVLINGKNVHRLRRKELFALRRNIGLLFQSGALFTDMTVFQNVAFPLRLHTKLPEDMIRTIVMLKLECVGLRGSHAMMPSELSGGMTRRVALARAIALDPQLLMYDEPFAGQDPIGVGVLLSLIKMLNANTGATTLIVSHDLHETLSIADYVFVLANGKVIGKGDPQSLRASRSPFVRQFMHGRKDGPVAFHYPAPPLAQDLGLRERQGFRAA